MFEHKVACDVIFVVGLVSQQNNISAHKYLFCLKSLVFITQFCQHDEPEAQTTHIIVEGTPAQTFTELLR